MYGNADKLYPCLEFELAFEHGDALILRPSLLKHVKQVTAAQEEMDAEANKKHRFITDKRTDKSRWASLSEFAVRHKEFEYVTGKGASIGEASWDTEQNNPLGQHTNNPDDSDCAVLAPYDLMQEMEQADVVNELIGPSSSGASGSRQIPPSAMPAGPSSSLARPLKRLAAKPSSAPPPKRLAQMLALQDRLTGPGGDEAGSDSSG
jgi:hypothetical protein